MNFPNAINSPTASDLARKTIVELANYVYLTAVAYSGNAEYAEQFLRELAAQAQAQIDALVDVAASYASDAETASNNAQLWADRAATSESGARASASSAEASAQRAASVGATAGRAAALAVVPQSGVGAYANAVNPSRFMPLPAAGQAGVAICRGNNECYYRPFYVSNSEMRFPSGTTSVACYDANGHLTVSTPDNATDAANKDYVDTMIAALRAELGG